jgi:hypothetical protein
VRFDRLASQYLGFQHLGCALVCWSYLTKLYNALQPSLWQSRGDSLVDTIIGDDCKVTGCTLGESMIGDHVVIEGITESVSLGDHAEVRVPNG